MKHFNLFMFLVLSFICVLVDNSVNGIHVLRCGPEMLVPALILGGGSLLGSVFGSIFGSSGSSKQAAAALQSAKETNETNLQISRETNQSNREMVAQQNAANLGLAREQNQWNLQQWNRENQYNSPANQVQLYKAAGLNPATLGGQITPAQQLTSADLANQQASRDYAPTMQDPFQNAAPFMRDKYAYMQQIGTAMSDFSRGMVDISRADSEIKRNEFLNKYTDKNIEMMTKNIEVWSKQIEKVNLDMIHSDGRYLEEIIKLKSEVNVLDSISKLNVAEKDYKVQMVKNAKVQEDLNKIQIKLGEIDVDCWRSMRKSQIAQLAASAYNFAQHGNLMNQEYHYRDTWGGFSPSDIMQENLLDRRLNHEFTQNFLDRNSREKMASWTNNTQILTHLMDNNTRLFTSRDFHVAKLILGDLSNFAIQYGYETGLPTTRKGFIKAALDTKEEIDKNNRLVPIYKGYRNKKAFFGNVRY